MSSSGITFSGFNNIDFSSIVTALMNQASQPLTDLQTKQTNLGTQAGNFSLLATKVSALKTAAAALSTSSSIASFTGTSTDSSAVTISASSSATAGHYDVVVQDLARAQVMASNTSAPDADTTIVATGGTITIGGQAVAVSGNVTLQQLADTINATANMTVSASVIQAGTNNYRLVLTSNSSGVANAFTVQNALTGGSGVAFTDTDGDGTSGDTAADNAVSATDASVLINNIQVTSSSNTLDSVVPGATITLYKKDPAATVGLDVSADSSTVQTNINAFITAYNNLQSFVSEQATSAGTGDATSIGRDPLLRSLGSTLRSSLLGSYAVGGSYDNLSQIGIEFTRSGTLKLNTSVFSDAVSSGTAGITALLTGSGSVSGAFSSINDLLTEYTQSSGLLDNAQTQLTNQISRLGTQITAMQARLAQQKLALQAQFTAADNAMSQLNSQSSTLSSLFSSSS